MKIRCEYSVGPELKFLSNLDMMRMMERSLRRGGIPYAQSEGFNPHIKLSMGTVLPVGLWGAREYFDLELTKTVDLNWFREQMNAVLPPYIIINHGIAIDSNEPSLMKTINAASYCFKIQRISELEVNQLLDNVMKLPDLIFTSRGKKKDVKKDLKSSIHKIEVKGLDNSVIIDLTVAIGEPVNVRFDELKDLLLWAGIKEDDMVDVYRKANYIIKAADYYSPLEKVG